MSFSAKKIRVVVQLFEGSFFSGVSSLEFVDLPIEATIQQVQLPSAGSAVIKIYGVSKSHMDAITTIQWKTGFIEQKSVSVFVNEGDGEHLIYSGNITKAIPCYESAPDVYIRIDSCAGAFWNTDGEVPPYSHKGMIPVHLALAEMCAQYGVVCKNFGVLDSCQNPHFNQKGLKNRLNAAALKYGIDITIGDGVTPDVNIFPKGRHLAKTWHFTKDNYIGYPSFNDCGIQLMLDRTYPDMDLKDFFTVTGSEISAANDTWKTEKIEYKLSTKIGGNWLMGITGIRSGLLYG